MRLEIESLGGGGRGVARADGRVWFVAGALPGELVEAEPERARAGVVEARTVAVLRPGPWREPEPCPVAAACGGCDLAHVRRQQQLRIADSATEAEDARTRAGAGELEDSLHHIAPQGADGEPGAPVAFGLDGLARRVPRQC